MKIETLTNTSILYRIHRHRDYYLLQIQKRKFYGYCIKLLLVIAIGVICWHFKPIPFGNGQGVSLTTQGDR